MAVKIRLQRHGKKGKPFYHIVAADARAKRDGRYIEKIGTYNPNTNPASIDLQIDRAVNWLQNGAIPTDTARAILSYKGALYKNHLLNGVKKGAFDEKTAEKKFEGWLAEKTDKIAKQAEKIAKGIQSKKDEQLATEKAQSEARAKEIAEKNSAMAAEAAATEAETAEETVAEETVAEETATEETATEETVAEETVAEETVAEETAAEETAAEETAAEETATEETATEETATEEEATEEE